MVCSVDLGMEDRKRGSIALSSNHRMKAGPLGLETRLKEDRTTQSISQR